MRSASVSDARQLFAAARRRILTLTVSGTFVEACALVIGYDCASGRWLLDGFQQWLGDRHDGRSELAFWIHILREEFPDEPSLKAQELTLEQNQLAIDRLFSNLDDFLGGLVEN